MISCDTFEPTYSDWFVLDATTATGRFARAITDPAENAGKNVRFTILHVRRGEITLRDHADIRGNVSVGRTAPLAIDDLMEVIRVGGICWLHSAISGGSACALELQLLTRNIAAQASVTIYNNTIHDRGIDTGRKFVPLEWRPLALAQQV